MHSLLRNSIFALYLVFAAAEFVLLKQYNGMPLRFMFTDDGPSFSLINCFFFIFDLYVLSV